MTTPPTPAELELFQKLLNGHLPVAEVERLAAEYADDQRIAELAEAAVRNDTLLDSIRGHRTIPDVETERIVERLISRIKDAGSPSDKGDETTGLPGVTPAEPPQIPEWLEYFRIKSVLGQGGMGTVYLADDTRLDRPVAVKTLRVGAMLNAGAKDRFLREARLAAKLDHDHIIPIYYVGESDGIPFLAMPLLQGEPLDRCLQRRAVSGTPLPVSEAVRIAGQIASGLAAAHAQGLIHRDIKPANVWVEAPTGRVKILDFGLARSQQDSTLTASGAVVGTPAYMAPEQGRGLPVDHRADLFSLGSVLYEMVTGQRAFKGPDTMAILTSLAVDTPQQPHMINPQCPLGLSQLTMRLLAKQPDDRVASAMEVVTLLAALKPALKAGTPVGDGLASDMFLGASDEMGHLTTLVEPIRPAVPSRRRRRLPVAAVAVLLTFLVGGAYGGTIYRVATNQGELVIEIDDPDVEVKILQGGLVVKDKTGQREFTLTAGRGEIEVFEKDGVKIRTKEFELTRGGQSRVKVTFQELADARKPKDSPKPEPKASADPDRTAAEYVLSVGGSVRINGGKSDVGRMADLPREPFRLTQANLRGNQKVTDAGFAAFKGCQHLTALLLHETKVTDSGLAQFKDCDWRHLAVLDLTAANVTDASLALFKDCKEVEELHLNFTKVTDVGLAYFGACKRMRVVSLFSVPVTGEWLAAFDDCSRLEHLDLNYTRFNDAGMARLGNCRHLVELRLLSTQVTDKGLAVLRGCKELRELGLAETKITDAGLEHIKDCKKITFIRLHATRITDKGLSYLLGYENLECLEQRGSKVTKIGLDSIRKAFPKCQIDTQPEQEIPPPSAVLTALHRGQIPPEGLAAAGGGDPQKAHSSLVGVLGVAQPTHSEACRTVAFSPNGRWLATGSDDKTVILHDLTTDRVSRVLRGHTGAVSSVVFSKDSRTVISASLDGTLKLWPTERDAEPETLQPKVGEIFAMSASADGRFLAVGGTKAPIKLWKWGMWKTTSDVGIGEGKVTALAFSPDGETLASGWEDRKPETSIRIYKTADFKLVHSLAGHKNRIHALAFSPSGNALASAGGFPQLKVWNPASGKLTGEITGIPEGYGAAPSVAFGANETSLVFTMQGGPQLLLYDLETGKQRPLAGGALAISVAFGPEGKLLAVGSSSGGVYLADAKTWEPKNLEGGHRHSVNVAVFGPDGQTILSGGDDSTLRRWDLREVGKNQVIREFRDSVGLLAASPDGKTIAASAFPPGHGYWANVSDAVSGKELFRVYPLTLSKLAYSPDRKTLVVGYGNFFEAGNLRLWDLGLGEEVHRFAGPGIWHAVEFRADGKGIAAVDLHANFVRVWDVASGAEKSTWKDAFNPKKEFMPAAAIRPDFGLLAVGHDDGTIAVWDVATRQLKRTLAGHTGRPRMLKFTPDGSMLVSSGNDGTIRVWNPDVERSRAVIPLGPKSSPLTFDFDPSGKYICAIGNSPLIFVLRLAGDEK